VPPQSEQLFCDYVSMSSCQSVHQHEQGGACRRGSEHEDPSRCDHLY
jgi:hypothetical protein